MAMTITTLKNTNQETVIHFASSAAESGTITIANLAASTQARNSDTPRVNIVRFVTTGEDGAVLEVARGIKTIIACAPENAPFLDLTSMGITESQQNDQDIVIRNLAAKRISGYITLRKVAGWSGKIETGQFGSYDNESAVGS